MKNTLYETGIVPVIKLKDLDKTEKLAKALIEGGINFAEVTFRAENADEAIKRMLKAYPSMYVGAGTVLTMEEAKKAVEAGAKFIVCPGFDKEIVEYAQKRKNKIVLFAVFGKKENSENEIEKENKTHAYSNNSTCYSCWLSICYI